MKGIFASSLLLLLLPLSAQDNKKDVGPRPETASSRALDERVAVIESKLAGIDKLNDRLDKLQEKISDLSVQVASLNTKMNLVIWIGAAIGTILVAQFFAGMKRAEERPSEMALVMRYLIEERNEERHRSRPTKRRPDEGEDPPR